MLNYFYIRKNIYEDEKDLMSKELKDMDLDSAGCHFPRMYVI